MIDALPQEVREQVRHQIPARRLRDSPEELRDYLTAETARALEQAQNEPEPDRPAKLQHLIKHIEPANPGVGAWIRQAEYEHSLTLEDLRHDCIRIGWRLTRELSRLLMLLDMDEHVTALPADPDAWKCFVTPARAGQPAAGAGNPVRLDDARERALRGLQRLDAGFLPPDYTVVDNAPLPPDKDTNLVEWCELMRILAGALRVGNSRQWETEIDITAEQEEIRERLAIESMTTPSLARLCWPSRTEIIAYEQEKVAQGVHLAAAGGATELCTTLRKEGLTVDETKVIWRLAMVEIRAMHGSIDVEDIRALMVARTEDYIARCRRSNDLDREIKALKLLTMVTGLTRTNPENIANSFLEALDKSISKGPSATVVEATVVDPPTQALTS